MSLAEADRPKTQEAITSALIGAWRLAAFTVRGDDGEVSQPLGPNPSGQISYGADGHMSAHLVKGEGAYGPTKMPDYSAYYGRFQRGRPSPHRHPPCRRRLPQGPDRGRPAAWPHDRGDLLTLSAPLREGRGELVWRRLAPHPDSPA